MVRAAFTADEFDPILSTRLLLRASRSKQPDVPMDSVGAGNHEHLMRYLSERRKQAIVRMFVRPECACNKHRCVIMLVKLYNTLPGNVLEL